MKKLIFAFAAFTLILNDYCEAKKIRTVINFGPEVKMMIRNAMTECSKKETDASELIQMMKEGTWKEDKDFKTFMHCVYLRSGYSYEDTGRVKIDIASSVFPDPVLMKKLIGDCDKEATTQAVDPVETTFLNFKCFQINAPYSINFNLD